MLFNFTMKTSLWFLAILLIAGFSTWRSVRGGGGEAGSALPFRYDFGSEGRLEETSDPESSTSPYWWLNSGAYFTLWNGVGSTVQGELLADDAWRKLYAFNTPGETDDGKHPQNIFRLLAKAGWQDASQQVWIRINRYNLSRDVHRSESNGLLLFSRYQDENNLYYAGVRVDGNAVIKKKIGGTYYTLALRQVFPGEYDRASHPNLLPTGSWIGLRVETQNIDGTRVRIRLYADVGRTGTWEPIAEAVDDGLNAGGPAFTQAGRGGIRTDFMDADFDDYAADILPSATSSTALR